MSWGGESISENTTRAKPGRTASVDKPNLVKAVFENKIDW